MGAAMQQHFEQADDTHVMDFDAGIAHRADVIGKAMRCSSGKST
jgi:hypothetical protein